MTDENETTKTVEAPLPIGALAITRRVILRQGKDDIAFQVAIDSTAHQDDIFGLMDIISDVAERERLKSDLAEKREAHRVAQQQPALMDKDIARLTRERASVHASQAAIHQIKQTNGRRLPFKANPKQEADLQRYDQAIEGARLSKANFVRDLPIIEWEVACLEARIAGKPEPAAPERLAEILHDLELGQAAE